MLHHRLLELLPRVLIAKRPHVDSITKDEVVEMVTIVSSNILLCHLAVWLIAKSGTVSWTISETQRGLQLEVNILSRQDLLKYVRSSIAERDVGMGMTAALPIF